jgi:hypothetical protein
VLPFLLGGGDAGFAGNMSRELYALQTIIVQIGNLRRVRTYLPTSLLHIVLVRSSSWPVSWEGTSLSVSVCPLIS